MDDRTSLISPSLLERLKWFPTADLVRLLFPGHPVGRGGVMCSPFREETHPSFSCYRGGGGCRWKDWGTGEGGDNIDLYRKLYPALSYVEAVDGLARLALGVGVIDGPAALAARRRERALKAPMAEPAKTESVLRVVEDMACGDGRVPLYLRDYWRGRGISDAVMASSPCRYVIYENASRRGKAICDPASGTPLLDAAGVPLVDDGRREAIGLYNDLGGVCLRSPDAAGRRGFKGNIASAYLTTLLRGLRRPPRHARLCGDGDGVIRSLGYDAAAACLWISPAQYISAVEPHAEPLLRAFLYARRSRPLVGRTLECTLAVADALGAPAADDVVIVEGMFDALSHLELRRLSSQRQTPCDVVVANSVTNLVWAAPFVCRHRRAVLLLDHDAVSGAGQKASDMLRHDVALLCRAVGCDVVVTDGSLSFGGYKDLNDVLCAGKGFPVAGVPL